MLIKHVSGTVIAVLCHFVLAATSQIASEEQALKYLHEFGQQAQLVSNAQALTEWAYATNITKENAAQQLAFQERLRKFTLDVAQNVSAFNWTSFQNRTLYRAFLKLSYKDYAVLSAEENKELREVLQSMETTYATAKLCRKGKEPMQLEPGLTKLLATSRDYNELLWAWKGWRDETGRKMRKNYQRFVTLSNKAAVSNGRSDTGAVWRENFEYGNYSFQKDLEKLYEELRPLYEEVHLYVRSKLRKFYGEDKFPSSGHIPAHLLGNMWAQSWSNIEDLVMPFNNTKRVDPTPALQNKTIREIFEMANEFFVSLGLEQLSEEFWNRSMLEKPEDGREVVCHASAWDFSNGNDFRIKQCTRKTMEDFVTVHHEMGHIQYYMQYKDLNIVFRDGANSGFHEAVGDVLALSVATPQHLKEVGLVDSITVNNESDINFLLSMALDKIVFLPFAKLMDDYRWSIFNGSIKPENYNKDWWSLRCKYQGVSPPVSRTEQDFDAGAKYHIPANVPYIRYFVSYILQFQFHKALCQAANHTGPLYTCNIYRSKEAGAKLASMLQLGSSVEWPDALASLTGNRTMSAVPILDYFAPLITWLKDYNGKTDERNRTLWRAECPSPPVIEVESAECLKPDSPTPGSPTTSGSWSSLRNTSWWILSALSAVLWLTLNK